MKSHETVLTMDLRFIEMAENCIASAAGGLEFGDIFESVHTVDGVSKKVCEAPVDKLGAVLYTIASRLTDNHRDSLQLIADMFHSASGGRGSYRLEEISLNDSKRVF